MKTIINWNVVKLNRRSASTLPKEEYLFYFVDTDGYIKVGCRKEIAGRHLVYLASDFCPFDAEAGCVTKTVIAEIASGFRWCYISDVLNQEEQNHKRTPKIKSISEARRYAGISQVDMSKRLGIPRRSIEDWERGIRTPSEWVKKLIVKELVQLGNEKNGGEINAD